MKREISEVDSDCRLDISRVIEIVSNVYQISPHDITSRNRNEDFVKARYSCYSIIDSLKKGYSYINIGAMFNRDHASIIHGKVEHSNLMETNKVYKNKFDEISKLAKESFIELSGGSKTYQIIERIDNSIKGLESVKKALLSSYFDIKELADSIKEFVDELFPEWDNDKIKNIIEKELKERN